MLLSRLRPKVRIRRFNYHLNLIRHNSTRFFLETQSITNHPQDSDITNNDHVNKDYFEPKDESQIKLKRILTSRVPLLNPKLHYQQISKSYVPQPLNYDDFDHEPEHSYEQLISHNTNNPPVVGSIIEYVNPATNSISSGVVLREAQSKFNENYNKLIVLTSENIIESVSPVSVTFQLYEVLNPEWINSFNILDNRFDATLPGRSLITNILNEFIKKSLIYSKDIEPQFNIVFGQYALSHTITPISLLEIIESLRLSESLLTEIDQSYYHQCMLLMSIHMTLVNSPMWLVPNLNMLNRSSNVINHFSNQIIKGSDYFVNSEYNAVMINKFIQNCENEILFIESNKFLNQLYHDQANGKRKSLEDLNLYFNIWEGRHHKFIIDVLKFTIIYPHQSLLSLIGKFDVFKSQIPITPTKIYNFLNELNIYEDGLNGRHDPTHPLLSSNVMGEVDLDGLATSSPNQLMPSNNIEQYNSKDPQDYFQHLRKSKVYYPDHTIYGIPYKTKVDSELKESILAVSLEKINSRKYLINIHIPDIMTKISPDSAIIKSITSSSANMKVMDASKQDSDHGIFGTLKLDQFKFKNQNISEQTDNEWVSASDLIPQTTLDRIRNLNQKDGTTCLTISFLYNSYESNPFTDLQNKVTYSFDSLSSVCIKNISWNELEECLKGKSETSKAFRLFTRPFVQSTEDRKLKLLNNDDIHNVCFIHNILKTHIKLRNLEGASIKEPTTSLGENLSNGDNGESLPRSKFFVSEIEKFVGNLTASYCQYFEIPILTQEQNLVLDKSDDILNQSSSKVDPEDNALVTHHNTLLPSFYADTYYQTLLSRDINGYVSVPANIIARNYLQKSAILVNSGKNARHIPLGLNNGFVDLCNTFQDFESVVNQLQILNHIQSQANISFVQNSQSQISLIDKFSYLKGLGYNLNGPMGPSVLNAQLRKIKNSQIMIDHLRSSFKSFNALKQLEKSLQTTQPSDITYTCYVTHKGYRIDDINSHLVRGFCKELDLEVDILVAETSQISIGSTLQCDKVMYLDPTGGQCILKQIEGF
ncbi:hypothetical protein DFJ63DRAFT_104330 [Scheffersomyces coipomensis]|uniref:uncharacterized protein n=1 Tax=Scheffersomyces coipomensis TaxID=1788519 RepID=UPI00315CAE06